MRISSVTTYNIRNLKNQTVVTDSDYNILVGKNGQGKTNFLEALYIACYGNSFRKSLLKHTQTFGTSESFIKAVIETDREVLEVVFSLKNGKRNIHLQGKEIKDRKELIYTFPCIVFTHEDIDFVQGTPQDVRKFYNQTLTLYDPLFLDDMRKYNHLIKQRNMALRERQLDLLDLYDLQAAEVGIEIVRKREVLIKEFNEIFPASFTAVTGDDTAVSIQYQPSWKRCGDREEVLELLRKQRFQDLKYQMSTSGPHRDRFYVVRDGDDYVATASTGQKRLVSLIMRSAQAAFYTKKTGMKPILLLDDVLLELDMERRGRFLENSGGFSQAFFTFLPGETYFREHGYRGNIFTVDKGCITADEKSI